MKGALDINLIRTDDTFESRKQRKNEIYLESSTEVKQEIETFMSPGLNYTNMFRRMRKL